MKKRNTITKSWNLPKFFLVGFLFFLSILFLAYTYIAVSPVVLGINIQEFAQTRNTYSSVLKAKRGTIYDSNNDVLALNVYSYTVIAYLSPSRTTDSKNPKHVVDPKMTAEKLSPILEMDVSTLVDLMSREGLYQVELGPGGRNITELKKEAIEALNLPGIDFIESTKRFYPNGDFASYVIGYAKKNEYKDENGDISEVIDGELGIELGKDDILKGTDGYLSYQQDANGYKIPETSEDRVDAIDGDDIYLTIDASIQRFLEEAMDTAEQNYNYEWLQIHVMDAKNGDILASSVSPSFDPNIRNITNYRNNLNSVEIEPGSVMKTFTYMCAMEKGNYVGDKTIMSGTITVGDTYIKDWNNVGWGNITYDYGYVQSSNVAITNMLLVDKFIDGNDLKSCLVKYGFGSKTDIELPNESAGKLEFYYPIEIATAGFGQGIYVTPIQIMQGYTILSNNGKMLKPHIIKKIVNPNTKEVVYERAKEETEQLVSTATINKMHTLMNDVVNSPHGSGSGYSVSKYGIGLIGKTGTAQIFENGSYLRNQYIRSFVGMFPKEDPKIIIYGAIKKVNPDSNAALTSSIKSIVQNISKYYNMYSEVIDNSIPHYTLANYANKYSEGVATMLKELNLNPIVIGSGEYITGQYPIKGKTVIEGEEVFLLTNSNDYKMPNMKGWSRSDVVNYFDLIGAKYRFEGNGYVTNQSLEPNKSINLEEEIIINLESKY